VSIVTVTERLVLREFSPDEAEAMFSLNADPEVVRYTGDRPFHDLDEARQLLATYSSYRERGYGRWSVYVASTNEYIGFCGLAYRAETDEVDLGFRLYRAQWGRGYATEAGRAALEIGFHRYDLDRIVGRAMRENVASHRTLKRLGMRWVSAFERDGYTWDQYEITASEIEASPSMARGPEDESL